MQRIATTFAICFFSLLPLRASAQPTPEIQPIQPEENPIIPAVKWRTDLRISSPGRVYVDEDTVYILSAVHRAYKNGKVCEERDFRGRRLSRSSHIDPDSGIDWRLESELQALTKENGGLKWSFEAEEDVSVGWVSTSMMSAGDFVYFHVGDTLHTLSRDLGHEKWTFQAPQTKRRFPLLSWIPGICVLAVIVVVIGRFLRIWTRTKTVVLVVALLIMVIGVALGLTAFFQTPSRYAASLQVANGSVYFRSSNGFLCALAGDTGQLRWRCYIAPSWKGRFSSVLRSVGIERVPNPPPPVVSGDAIIVQDDIREGTSRLVAYDAKTRDVLWTSDSRVIAEARPTAASGTVYATTRHTVVALAVDTGTLKWQSDQIKTSDHVVPRDSVVAYVPGWDDKSRWQTAQFRARVSNPPQLLGFEGDLLCVLASTHGDLELIGGGGDPGSGHDRAYVNHVLALSASTGKVRWKRHIGVNIGRTIVRNNTVYFVSQDRLYAMELDTGKVGWQWQCPKSLLPGENSCRYTSTSIGDYVVAADASVCIVTDQGVFALDPRTPKKQLSLPNFEGKVVLLNFWSPWCDHSLRQIPQVETLYNKYRDLGLVVIGIHRGEDDARVKEFARGRLSYITLADGGNQLRQYGVTAIPTTLYIDRQGKIRYRDVGFKVGKEKQVEQKVEELLESS